VRDKTAAEDVPALKAEDEAIEGMPEGPERDAPITRMQHKRAALDVTIQELALDEERAQVSSMPDGDPGKTEALEQLAHRSAELNRIKAEWQETALKAEEEAIEGMPEGPERDAAREQIPAKHAALQARWEAIGLEEAIAKMPEGPEKDAQRALLAQKMAALAGTTASLRPASAGDARGHGRREGRPIRRALPGPRSIEKVGQKGWVTKKQAFERTYRTDGYRVEGAHRNDVTATSWPETPRGG